MQVPFYFPTINPFQAKLQCHIFQSNWTIPDLLLFLRCLPHHYNLFKEKIQNSTDKYYIIYDNDGPIFKVFFANNNIIEIIILKISNISYSQISFLYKNISQLNFRVDIFKFKFNLNFYMLGKNPNTAFYKISNASFDLLKKLVRLFPLNNDIKNEQILCINSYSQKQQRNISKSLAKEIGILQIMLQYKGITKIFTHKKENGEIEINNDKSVHAFSWVAPWAYEVIHKFQYVELDCTFSILFPYVVSIPQFIVNGISLPVGYVAGPQEASELYSLFYNELQFAIGPSTRLHLIPVLSDEGSGLIKFCNDNKLLHFFCIRHIIEKIGAKSFWGKLIARLLMAQTEEDFNMILQKNIAITNGYLQENRNIPEKFLEHSFIEIKGNIVRKKENIDEKFLAKIALYKRSLIAAASNHCEGFHRQLKKISKEKKGFEYNLSQLYNKINKRFEKYISGESADKLCTRIKDDLLKEKHKYHIVEVEHCDCTTNHHKKMMYACNLPCRHTVTDESVIEIKYPILDTNKFINRKLFNELPSNLKSHISMSNKIENVYSEEVEPSAEEVENALKRAHLLFESKGSQLFTVEIDIIIRNMVMDALNLGLKNHQIDDFIKFYLIEFMMSGYNTEELKFNKDRLLGRYFGINKIC